MKSRVEIASFDGRVESGNVENGLVQGKVNPGESVAGQLGILRALGDDGRGIRRIAQIVREHFESFGQGGRGE